MEKCRKKTRANFEKLLQLILFLTYSIHLFASCWSYLGLFLYHQDEKSGWINALIENGLLKEQNLGHVYMTSLYFIITSFATVGFGDIKGDTDLEYFISMIMMITGIGFFAYIMGNLNNILQSFSSDGSQGSQEENLDQFLIQLDRSYKDKNLDSDLYSKIKYFFQHVGSRNVISIKRTDFFQ